MKFQPGGAVAAEGSIVPNESRLGLVVGVVLVVVVGLLFYQGGPSTTGPGAPKAPSTATAPAFPSAALPTATSAPSGGKETKGLPTGRTIR